MQRETGQFLDGFGRFLLLALVASTGSTAAASTTVLGSSPNPSTLSQPVTLTATVSPGTATGRVTFYDGTTILGVGTVSSGQAVLTTTLLPSGARSLTVRYDGDAGNAPSLSAVWTQTVVAVAGGTFGGSRYFPYRAVQRLNYFAIGDFDGDGKPDLIVVDSSPYTLTVGLGKGDGTFQPVAASFLNSYPRSVAVGDLNGDGKADLVVASVGASVLLGKGDGTFQPALDYAAGSGTNKSVAIGDFNGDGKADLVLAGDNLNVLLGNGDGTFQPARNFPTGYNTQWVSISDFDGDGRADLAVASQGGVSVLLGNGNGTFQPAVNYPVGLYNYSMAIGDFNGDGKADLAVACTYGLGVLLGNGNGTFQAAVNNSEGVGPGHFATSVAAGDFDGDGKTDLAVGIDNNDAGVLLGKGDGTFQAWSVPAATFLAGSILAVSDFNGDGRADLVGMDTFNVKVFPGAALIADIRPVPSSSPQFGVTNKPFSAPLAALVLDQFSHGIANVAVTFTAPATGPSGVFQGGGAVASATTDSFGRATPPSFIANDIIGGPYNVTAIFPGSTAPANFVLTNTYPPPTADSVSPSSGSGLSQVFTFNYSSANGAGYLNGVYAVFNTSVNGAGACFVLYDRPSNGFYLYNDAGNAIAGPITPGFAGVLTNSQCTLTGSGSSVSGSGNTLSMVLNLSFTPLFQGGKKIFMYTWDSGGMNSGWQTRGSWTVALRAPPTADSVSPASGTGPAGTFTFKYSSGNGFGYLNDVYALFNTSVNGAGACFVLYDRPSNGFYLYNDAGSALIGPLAPGGISNSQCTLSGGSVTGAGNTLTMYLSLGFSATFFGAKTQFLYAADAGGLNSGWQSRGSWTSLTGTPPTADNVNPAAGAGTTQNFAFQYSSVNGAAYLKYVYMLINTSVNSAGACMVFYDVQAQAYYLYNDAGNGVLGPLPATGAGSLSNSQCTVTGFPPPNFNNILIMSIKLTFKPAFQGKKTIFMYAADNGGLNSGWQNRGTWTISGPPTADSVGPSSAAGASQTFTFSYSSAGGYGNLSAAYALLNGSLSQTAGCFLYYNPGANLLYLANDAGNAWTGGVTPGGTATLQNSQCTVKAAASSVEPAGNTLKLTFTATASPSFNGVQTVFGYAADNANANSGWQTLGTWNSFPGPNPTADSVTPSAVAGNAQSFTFSYSSPGGFANLSVVYALINGSLSTMNGCFVQYYPAANTLYLVSDSGTAIAGSVTPGVAGTAQNSQCTINGLGSSANAAGNTLSLTVSATGKAPYDGARTVLGYASDASGLNSGCRRWALGPSRVLDYCAPDPNWLYSVYGRRRPF